MALIAPNLAARVSKRGGESQAGASLGVQNAVNSLGQAAGPMVGGRAVHLADQRPLSADRSIADHRGSGAWMEDDDGGARRTQRRFE